MYEQFPRDCTHFKYGREHGHKPQPQNLFNQLSCQNSQLLPLPSFLHPYLLIHVQLVCVRGSIWLSTTSSLLLLRSSWIGHTYLYSIFFITHTVILPASCPNTFTHPYPSTQRRKRSREREREKMGQSHSRHLAAHLISAT